MAESHTEWLKHGFGVLPNLVLGYASRSSLRVQLSHEARGRVVQLVGESNA